MEVVKPVPLAILLFQLGACREAFVWAGKKPMNAEALADCPSLEWRNWLAEKLGVKPKSSPEEYEQAAQAALSGTYSIPRNRFSSPAASARCGKATRLDWFALQGR
jgi:hypothetical protein